MNEPTATALSDDALRARSGDRAAFGRLVDAHLPQAYRLSLRYLTSADDAKDASQEAFVRAWEHIDRFDTTRPFGAWLTTIVTRICLDRLRGRERSPFRWFRSERVSFVEPPDPGPDPHEGAEWSDLASIVLGLIGRLPPTQRVVFALRDLEDLELEEVAECTGISASSVKANLSYARRTIRAILANEYHVKGTHP